MQAAVLDGFGNVDITEIPDAEPGPGEVLIAPRAVGICGTDLHLATGDYPTGTFPIVPGHEFAGHVVALGEGVDAFAPGEAVCVDPNVNCGHCGQCAVGATNLCPNLVPIGVTRHGACADLVSVPASVVYRLPEGIDMAAGALIEPLACVLHAFGRVRDVEGQRLLVYGAGSIGLLAIALAGVRGAASIDVIEPSAVRRSAAAEFGAGRVHAPGQRPGSRDVDVVIEASGHPSAVSDALQRLDNRGTLLQMGVVSPKAAIDLHPYDLFDRELSLVGSQSLATAYGEAVTTIATIPDLVPRMVTHSFSLSNYAQALRTAGSEDARKVQLVWPNS